jgi:hypothetical protein
MDNAFARIFHPSEAFSLDSEPPPEEPASVHGRRFLPGGKYAPFIWSV